MESGRIIYSGGVEVAGVLEHEGYEGVKKLLEDQKQPSAAWWQQQLASTIGIAIDTSLQSS